MRRLSGLLLSLCLLLVACGSKTPSNGGAPSGASATTAAQALATATPEPTPPLAPTVTPTPARPTPTTTRPRPTPTATIPPTVVPTPSPTRLPAATTVNERTGQCKMGLPAGFAAGDNPDTWVSADRLVSASLVAPDATGDPSLDAATTAGIAGLQKALTGYQETSRVKAADARRVAFTGKLGGKASWGILYLRQFGLDFCQLTVTATDGTTLLIEPLVETMAGSLVATRPRPAPIGYVALGDSYAAGIGAQDPASGGYAAQFASTLRGPNGQPMGLQNLAVSGATSADYLGDWKASGRDGKSPLAGAVKALGVPGIAVVTIDIGGNDILRLMKPGQPCADKAIDSDACLAALQAALATMTTPNLPPILGAIVEAAQPGTQILVLTYPNPFSTGQQGPTQTRTDQAMADLNTIITSAARNLNARATARQVTLTVVDLAPLFAGQGSKLTHIQDNPPDIHPTDAGHAVIAEALVRAYKK
jgi:lysophospholipase L1-like esterase